METPTFDKKTFLVLISVGLVFILWQKYLEQKYPDLYTKKAVTEQVTQPTEQGTVTSKEEPRLNGGHKADSTSPALKASEKFLIKTKVWEGFLNSMGMGFEQVQDLRYTDRQNKPIFYSQLPIFRLLQLDSLEPIFFSVVKKNDFSFQGVARLEDGTEIVRSITIDEFKGTVQISTELSSVSPQFKGFAIQFADIIQDHSGSSILTPAMDLQELVARKDGSVERFRLEKNQQKEIGTVDLFALSSHYFTVALVDKSNLLPIMSYTSNEHEAIALLKYVLPPSGDTRLWNMDVYIGPKLFEQLAEVSGDLTQIIDFGWFSSIGTILLQVLKWAYDWVGNWGWAIIILTLIVRVVVLPFALFSYKSMKKMQAIQPKLQALRERFKDDPVALNRETMNLMKNEKVNPLGGCLPMLLQMPVFFALYQVLSHAIELYKAPFIFWIHDLSSKDPYFVLPILMGIVLFIQHKITPTTMDPQQAKIMAWMPVIFTVFTLGLPSGLTLYILVSTLFAVIQQKWFMWERKQEA